MIKFVEKIFTVKSIVEDNIGIINEILSHILKLKYKFNYEYDSYKHKNDITNIFFKKLLKQISKDKTIKSPERIIKYYKENSNLDKIRKEIETDFIKNYGFKSKITEKDFNFSISIFESCLILSNLNDIRKYLDEIL